MSHAGHAKISDFGLARLKMDSMLSTNNHEVGTICYMAPECFKGAPFEEVATIIEEEAGSGTLPSVAGATGSCMVEGGATGSGTSHSSSDTSSSASRSVCMPAHSSMRRKSRKGCGLNEKVDIYALGIILWEMVTGLRAWQDARHPIAVALQVRLKVWGLRV